MIEHRSDCAKHGDNEHSQTLWKPCNCGALITQLLADADYYAEGGDPSQPALDRLPALLREAAAALAAWTNKPHRLIYDLCPARLNSGRAQETE